MKNYFKKFSIMFVMALMVVLGCATSAFAATDDWVVGTSNLHNTPENSAVVGKELAAPEVGWNRYDDSNSMLAYKNTTLQDKLVHNPPYTFYAGSTDYWSYTRAHLQKDSVLKFCFYGDKFRIISDKYHPYRTGTISLTIDGEKKNVNLIDNSQSLLEPQILQYESEKMNLAKHIVVVTCDSNYTSDGFILDSIDIKDGKLLPYSDESITVDHSSMNLTEGDSSQLTAITTPSAIGVTWISSDPSVATIEVDPTNGKLIKVNAIKEGTCTITATTADGLTATCTVTVTKENKSISLNKPSTNLIMDDSETLIATTTPAGISVKWSSSDTSVATVDSNGKVTAIGAGTATITATTLDGSNLSASCLVTVVPKGDGPTPAGSEYITNIAHAKGTNTNNPGGEVTIIFHGTADTTLSVVKTADAKDVWIGDNFTYTLVITNTGAKTAKAVVVNDPAPNHIDFNVSGVTTTQGSVDSSSTSKNIIVNVGDIPPAGTVTIKVPATVIA
jgi:uncharacterized repeat protein (TIGR01451 family)